MNTRLQVEHPVTELVTGIDLVEQQFLIAAGRAGRASTRTPSRPRGHAIELRVYAEDPTPVPAQPGHDHRVGGAVRPGHPGGRRDTRPGTTVTPFYDPLLAKLCVHGADRDEALAPARGRGGGVPRSPGLKTNLPFHAELLGQRASSSSGDYDTGLVSRLRPRRERPSRSAGPDRAA